MAIEILKIYVFSQFSPSFFLLIVLFIFDFLAVFSQGIASRRFVRDKNSNILFFSSFSRNFWPVRIYNEIRKPQISIFLQTLLLSCNQTTWNRGSVGTDRHSGLTVILAWIKEFIDTRICRRKNGDLKILPEIVYEPIFTSYRFNGISYHFRSNHIVLRL